MYIFIVLNVFIYQCIYVYIIVVLQVYYTSVYYYISVSYTHLDVYKRQAEYFLRISQPIRILNGKLWAIKNIIGSVSTLLMTSRDTCLLMVLCCLPVAPIKTMLLTGNVGKLILLSFWIFSYMFISIKDTFAPVSYTHLDVYKRQMYLCVIMFNTLFVVARLIGYNFTNLV